MTPPTSYDPPPCPTVDFSIQAALSPTYDPHNRPPKTPYDPTKPHMTPPTPLWPPPSRCPTAKFSIWAAPNPTYGPHNAP